MAEFIFQKAHEIIVAFLERHRDSLEKFVRPASHENRLLMEILESNFTQHKDLANKMKLKTALLSKRKVELNEKLSAFCSQCDINPPIQVYFQSQGIVKSGGHFSCSLDYDEKEPMDSKVWSDRR